MTPEQKKYKEYLYGLKIVKLFLSNLDVYKSSEFDIIIDNIHNYIPEITIKNQYKNHGITIEIPDVDDCIMKIDIDHCTFINMCTDLGWFRCLNEPPESFFRSVQYILEGTDYPHNFENDLINSNFSDEEIFQFSTMYNLPNIEEINLRKKLVLKDVNFTDILYGFCISSIDLSEHNISFKKIYEGFKNAYN